MVDIEKLKEICGDEALSETPSRYITTSECLEAFEAFVEEVSPAAVLELIAEVERFKAERDQLRAEVEALRGLPINECNCCRPAKENSND